MSSRCRSDDARENVRESYEIPHFRENYYDTDAYSASNVETGYANVCDVIDLLYEVSGFTGESNVRFAIYLLGVHLVDQSILHGHLAPGLRIFNACSHP